MPPSEPLKDLHIWLERLGDLDREVRLLAIQTLSQHRSKQVMMALRQCLYDVDREVRQTAAQSLQAMGDTHLGKSDMDPYGQFGL